MIKLWTSTTLVEVEDMERFLSFYSLFCFGFSTILYSQILSAKTEVQQKQINASEKSNSKQVQSTVIPVPKTDDLKPNEFYIFMDGKYEKLVTKTYKEARFAPDCFKGQTPKCMAFDIFEKAKNNSSDSSNKNPLPNFAAQFCIDQGGANLIALGKNRNEYNFCQFADKSMVNSWDLYLKYNPVKVIK